LSKAGARRWLLRAAAALALWSLAAWGAALALVVEAGPEQADALVVLAGSSTYRERAHHAARLYAEGRAPLLLLTDDGQRGGWSEAEQRNPLFVERAAEELRRGGVPAERIRVVSPSASSTYEEALRVREFAAARGLRSLLLVPAAYQSRRALWTFTHVLNGTGINVGVDAPSPGEQTPRPALWWLHPLGWRLVPGEYIKLIYYVLVYR
jgi:uncharacterized SAM-binding protein YcdF (DUF218 family)